MCQLPFRKMVFFSALLLSGVLPEKLMSIEKLDTTKVYSITELTVTEQNRKNEVRSSAPLQKLTAKQIDKLNSLQVSDAVKFFSGVTLKDYGGIGGLKTVSVRSLGASHTAVSYDGIMLNDGQTGQIDIGRFSLENTESVSLSNGQSDNIFQPARAFAAAAVLNIQSSVPVFDKNKNYKGKVTFRIGSFGLQNPSFLFQNKISHRYSLSASGEWLTANGEYPYKLQYDNNDGLTTNEIRKNSDVSNIRLETAFHATFSENESAYLKAYFYDSDRGLPGATIFYNESAFTSQRLHDNTFFAQAHYQKAFSQKWSFQANAKYNHSYTHYTDTVVHNNAGFEENFYRQNEFYGSTSVLYRLLEQLSFSFSGDGSISNLSAEFDNEALTNDFARPVRYSFLSVLAGKWVSNHFLATASVISTTVTDNTKASQNTTSYNRLSPYFSVSYKPFQKTDLRIRTFYKNIFRLPSFNDLYYSRVGNIGLKPETTNQLNLGATYSFSYKKVIPLFTFTADVYRNNVKDKIVAMPTKNIFIWSMKNLGKVEITGLDLSSEADFKLSEKVMLNLGATYSYQRALDVTTPGNETYGHQIPYVPRVSGSAKAAIETPWVDVAYTVLWSGARYAGYQNYAENRLPGYSDHSISVSHNFQLKDKTLAAKLEVLNLLNENYAVIRYFPMPGRSVRATVSYKF